MYLFVLQECELHSAVYYQSKLNRVTQRVAELEEMVEGKQLALDKLVRENEAFRSQQISAENQVGNYFQIKFKPILFFTLNT